MVKLIMMFRRKPGTAPEQFREYYEKSHAPLAMRLMPYFQSYQRNFVRHDLSYRPGLGAEIDFDVVTELTFASRADYDAMVAVLSDPALHQQIVADEENFMDRSAGARRMFFVEEENSAASSR